MNLRSCLQAEIRKARNSFALWLSLAGTVANVLIFFIIHYFSSDWMEAGVNPWQGYVNGHYAGVAFMMLPLYVIILCSLVTFMEHRQRMWGNLFTMAVSKRNLYWSKQFFTLLLFAAAHILFIIGLLFSGLLMGVVRPETGLLTKAPDFVQLFSLAFQTVWSVLGLLALHFWISWRFQHFIIPLLIGILGFVVVSFLGPDWYGSNFIPYAYPIQYMPAYQGTVDLPLAGGALFFVWLSPMYFLIFSVLGFRDVRRLEMG